MPRFIPDAGAAPPAVTANVMSHQVAEYAAAGMDDVIAEAIEALAVLDAIDQALSTLVAPETSASTGYSRIEGVCGSAACCKPSRPRRPPTPG